MSDEPFLKMFNQSKQVSRHVWIVEAFIMTSNLALDNYKTNFPLMIISTFNAIPQILPIRMV